MLERIKEVENEKKELLKNLGSFSKADFEEEKKKRNPIEKLVEAEERGSGRPRGSSVSDEEVGAMKAEGKSVTRIAGETGVSVAKVFRIVKKTND